MFVNVFKKERNSEGYCSHFIAFSKWAKVEGYIDLRVTVPLLFNDSLKSQTWLFSYRSFAGPSTIFKFSHSEQIWGLQSIELFWGLNILEILYKNWVPSINEKQVQKCSLATQICEKVKKNTLEHALRVTLPPNVEW